jgi:HB1, ASXL, restriction endonuclease HTH domain
MAQNNIIAQLDAAIASLEQKKKAIDDLLASFKRSRAIWSELPPSVLALLDEPEELLQAARSTQELAPASTELPKPGDKYTLDVAGNVIEKSPDQQTGVHARTAASQLGPPQDLAGCTIVECARKILREHDGGPLHFREIAEMAANRGYQSGRPGVNRKTLYRSFWAMLNRNEGMFRAVGGGNYKLKVGEGSQAEN